MFEYDQLLSRATQIFFSLAKRLCCFFAGCFEIVELFELSVVLLLDGCDCLFVPASVVL